MNLEKAASIITRSLTPNKPYHVQWMITRKCNYRCKGCNVWREQDRNELLTEDVKRGLDVLREMGVIEVVISGGNPLLREDIGEIIEYSSRFFITTVYDNGSMAAKKVDDLRNADFVAISLDSLDPEKNDYIKGVKGAWKQAMSAIEILQKEGICVSVTPTISQLNLYEIIDLTNYFLQRGIPLWYCLYSYDLPYEDDQLFRIGKKNDEFLITDKKAMVTLLDSLSSMKRKNSNIFMTTRLLKVVKDLYLKGIRTWKCHALQSFFTIDHLGRVAACHLHKPVASIFDLPKIWSNRKMDDLRKTYSECNRCTYLCYIFYSIYGSVRGNIKIAEEHWKNAKKFFKRNNVMSSYLVNT